VDVAISITIFLVIGLGFVLAALVVGGIVRPNTPNPVKKSTYECGEPTVGPSWIQFDIRFYVVALFYLIFDVEIALLWPIASIFRTQAGPALIIAGVFMLIIIVGFAYEWYSGSLDWVRSTINTSTSERLAVGGEAGARFSDYIGSSQEMAELSKRDPEALLDELDQTSV